MTRSLRTRCGSGEAAAAASVAITLLLSLPAGAQRAKDNAVTSASDAFGTVVGNQSIGLYSPADARGFNPTQAQNVRIDGLYFDLQTSTIDPYLFKSTDMRVGISAQSYAFPSPSGIADLTLRTPGDAAGASRLCPGTGCLFGRGRLRFR